MALIDIMFLALDDLTKLGRAARINNRVKGRCRIYCPLYVISCFIAETCDCPCELFTESLKRIRLRPRTLCCVSQRAIDFFVGELNCIGWNEHSEFGHGTAE
jgi:hypothetical protein